MHDTGRSAAWPGVGVEKAAALCNCNSTCSLLLGVLQYTRPSKCSSPLRCITSMSKQTIPAFHSSCMCCRTEADWGDTPAIASSSAALPLCAHVATRLCASLHGMVDLSCALRPSRSSGSWCCNCGQQTGAAQRVEGEGRGLQERDSRCSRICHYSSQTSSGFKSTDFSRLSCNKSAERCG